MKKLIPGLLILIIVGCSPTPAEETENDSTKVAELDTTTFANETTSTTPEAPSVTKGSLNGEEFILEGQYSYISSPFDISLDSATIAELLGPDVQITSHYTEGGEDEEGTYQGWTFYEVEAGENKMSFYDYSGKHFADIYTPKITFKNGVVVGMSKDEFLKAMSIEDEKAREADKFTIDDDYGWMYFSFSSDTLYHVYVSYEEGT